MVLPMPAVLVMLIVLELERAQLVVTAKSAPNSKPVMMAMPMLVVLVTPTALEMV